MSTRSKRVETRGGTFGSNSGTVETDQISAGRNATSTRTTNHDESQARSSGHNVNLNINLGNSHSGSSHDKPRNSQTSSKPSRPSISIPIRDNDGEQARINSALEVIEHLRQQLDQKNSIIRDLQIKLDNIASTAIEDIQRERDESTKQSKRDKEIHSKYASIKQDILTRNSEEVAQLEKENFELGEENRKLREQVASLTKENRMMERKLMTLEEREDYQSDARSTLSDERNKLREERKEKKKESQTCLGEMEECDNEITRDRKALEDYLTQTKRTKLEKRIKQSQESRDELQEQLDSLQLRIQWIDRRTEEINLELGELGDTLSPEPPPGRPPTGTDQRESYIYPPTPVPSASSESGVASTWDEPEGPSTGLPRRAPHRDSG